MGNEQPAYYCIIPATVRYDKRLSSSQKLMYGEITALTQSNGVCWASNKYFAELYGVARETVSRWINTLVDYGYIRNDVTFIEGTSKIDKRMITLCEPNVNIDEKINTLKKINTPLTKRSKSNNTRVNTTSTPISPEGTDDSIPLWRTDYQVYKKELSEAVTKMSNDSKWISDIRSAYPELDCRATFLNIKNYWTSPAGYDKKKDSKAKKISWKKTFNKGFTQEWNQVPLNSQQSTPSVELKTQAHIPVQEIPEDAVDASVFGEMAKEFGSGSN